MKPKSPDSPSSGTPPELDHSGASPAVSEAEPHRLPFSQWWPLIAGALSGLVLRFVFSGKPGTPYAAMMGAFIYLAPMFVGAITVYLAETKQRRSWAYYFYAPFLANVIFVFGTMLIMIEGLICALVIVPLFAVIGAVGGLLMGVICRVTNWPKRAIYGIGVLPLILGFLEVNVPLPERVGTVERTIVIGAAPDSVWRQIQNARDIKPEEVDRAWIFRIGVPVPLAGITQRTPSGLVRTITMGKSIHFDQVFTDWQENRYVHCTYHFYEDSFPARALDEHVVIGGHYFDMKDTSYTLTPRGNTTELRVRMRYRVSTQFNWYADAVAQGLLGNFEEVILDFYRHRSESSPEGNRRDRRGSARADRRERGRSYPGFAAVLTRSARNLAADSRPYLGIGAFTAA